MDILSKIKQIKAIDVYGGILIFIGILDLIWAAMTFEIFNTMDIPEFGYFVKWFPVVMLAFSLSLITFPMNIITGIGLLKRKTWARNGVIAAMLTLPFSLLCELLWWERLRLNVIIIFIIITLTVITLLFFNSPNIRKEFQDSASSRKLINYAIIISIVMLSFSPLLISMKIDYFNKNIPPPISISNLELKSEGGAEDLVNIKLQNVTMSIPNDMKIIRTVPVESAQGIKSMKLQGKGVMMLVENSTLGDMLKDRLPIVSNDGYNVERFINTNKWNPFAMLIRSISRPQSEKFEMYAINTSDKKGFLTILADKKRYFFLFSLYTKSAGSKHDSFAGFFIFDDVTRGKRLMPAILSSIVFL